MARKRKRAPSPRPEARKGKAPKLLAVLLALAMIVPMASSLIALGISGIRNLADSARGIDGEAAWLRDLLEDAGCPAAAARSIALECQDQDLLPALSVYYVPDDASADGSDGSAVMTTKRHMVSAAVQGGRLVALQVTDPYQNASILKGAGLTDEAARDAADWLYAGDAGLLSYAEKTEDEAMLLRLPDGDFILSGEPGAWILAPREGGGEDGQ